MASEHETDKAFRNSPELATLKATLESRGSLRSRIDDLEDRVESLEDSEAPEEFIEALKGLFVLHRQGEAKVIDDLVDALEALASTFSATTETAHHSMVAGIIVCVKRVRAAHYGPRE